MGKMLETLRQRGTDRRPAPQDGPATAAGSEDGSLLPAVEESEEVPFIEVGGKHVPMDASPAVLATAERTPRPVRLTAPATNEVASVTGLSVEFRPVAAELPPPQTRFAPTLITFHRPEQAQSRQYQALAASLLTALPAARSRVLLFTAVAPGAGTTTVLLNLAISLARQGKSRVGVVDANWRRPAVAEQLGLPEVPGLAELLSGSVGLGQVLQETGQANLLALTAGRCGAGAGPRLGGEAMRGLLRQLRERFELVLLDGPCWPLEQGLLALAQGCEAVYLVSPQGEAEAPETARLLQTLPQQGVPLRGHLLTAR
jgi:Mrp family chromosome partitioning ATPase